MNIRNLALCASVALLAACGGGDSSSAPPTGGGGGGGGGGGTPTPTPPATLPTFLELTGDQTFESACAKGADSTQNPFVAPFGQGTEHAFSAGPQTWRLSGNSPPNNVFDLQFAPSEIVSAAGAATVLYRRPSPTGTGNETFAFVTPQYSSATISADYVRGSFLFAPVPNNAPVSLYCVFGVPTPADATPPASPVTYSAQVGVGGAIVNFAPSGVVSYNPSPTTFSVTANPANGELTFTIALRGFQQTIDPSTGQPVLSTTATEFGTYTGTASVASGTQTFSGFLDKATGISLNAPVTGWFFGPQGAEIGVVISSSEQLTDGSNLALALAITGKAD